MTTNQKNGDRVALTDGEMEALGDAIGRCRHRLHEMIAATYETADVLEKTTVLLAELLEELDGYEIVLVPIAA